MPAGPQQLALLCGEAGSDLELDLRLNVAHNQGAERVHRHQVLGVRRALGLAKLVLCRLVGVVHEFVEADDHRLGILELLELQEVALLRGAAAVFVRRVEAADDHALVPFFEQLGLVHQEIVCALDELLLQQLDARRILLQARHQFTEHLVAVEVVAVRVVQVEHVHADFRLTMVRHDRAVRLSVTVLRGRVAEDHLAVQAVVREVAVLPEHVAVRHFLQATRQQLAVLHNEADAVQLRAGVHRVGQLGDIGFAGEHGLELRHVRLLDFCGWWSCSPRGAGC